MNKTQVSPPPHAITCPLTQHICYSALHIGDDPTLWVKGHTGVDGEALVPHAAQHQPTGEVLDVFSGHSPGSLSLSLVGRDEQQQALREMGDHLEDREAEGEAPYSPPAW